MVGIAAWDPIAAVLQDPMSPLTGGVVMRRRVSCHGHLIAQPNEALKLSPRFARRSLNASAFA